MSIFTPIEKTRSGIKKMFIWYKNLPFILFSLFVNRISVCLRSFPHAPTLPILVFACLSAAETGASFPLSENSCVYGGNRKIIRFNALDIFKVQLSVTQDEIFALVCSAARSVLCAKEDTCS